MDCSNEKGGKSSDRAVPGIEVDIEPLGPDPPPILNGPIDTEDAGADEDNDSSDSETSSIRRIVRRTRNRVDRILDDEGTEIKHIP